MFIIDIKYIVTLEEIGEYYEAHIRHLEKYYAQNIFVAWGPKVPRTGGVILALGESKEMVENIVREDPFYEYKLAEITITEFVPSKYQPTLSGLIK